jgi:LacI family transcriptional regulator
MDGGMTMDGRMSLPIARRPRRSVSIQDVARACGLAPSTVSNALSGKPYVREETRRRVMEVAAELGYRASAMARGLRLQRSWSIGLLLGDIANPYFPELMRGVEDVVAAAEYQLILGNTDYRADKQAAYLRLMRDKQVDGLILASQAAESPEVDGLALDGLPLVMLNQRQGSAPCDYVGVDSQAGLAATCRHLWQLGHLRIAYIQGRETSSAAQTRVGAFRDAMRALGAPVDPELIGQGDFSIESGEQVARRLLDQPDPPSAILAGNDLMAIGAMQAALDLGLSVPEDLSVVGFDDIFVAALPWINLTTVRQPTRKLGAAAARLLLERIEHGAAERPETIVLRPEFIVRGTTAPPCVRRRGGAS